MESTSDTIRSYCKGIRPRKTMEKPFRGRRRCDEKYFDEC